MPVPKKTAVLLSIIILLLLCYLPFDRPFGKIYSFKTIADNYIPLVTIFTIPYLSYFIFLPFVLFKIIKTENKKITEKVLFALISTVSFSYLCYFFSQNEVIRPEITPFSFPDKIYLFLNTNVPPYNAFPSLHVAISLICFWGLKEIKTKRISIFACWTLLIIISTVLTKQHYLVDIFGGVGCALFSAYLASKAAAA